MISFVQKTPTLITSSATQPIAVAAAGVEFSVGVTYQGQVVAWGSQEFGQVRICVWIYYDLLVFLIKFHFGVYEGNKISQVNKF